MRILVALAVVSWSLLSPLVALAGDTYVNGYYQSDGTYVEPHYRSSPNRNPYDNYSYPGNSNPYTGETATGRESTYMNNYYQHQSPAPLPPAPSVTPNAYGHGVNSDQFGRPHVYREQTGTAVDPIFQGGVKRDGYGAGVHQDQFGRPVYDSTP